ncbi:MAG TPA: small ribosomal subunit Rsm22 family protein, partial [Streptosporangiaceae bacterium]|nr:small ribosomal subunit Rsm22 family protein [Streptosporangiaceae bacterium]
MTGSPQMADNPLSAAATEVALPTRDLARAYRTLSDRYHDAPANDNFRLGPKHASAYLVARLPATYAVVRGVLEEIARLRPNWRPASMLDIGAGPGTAMWAAAATFSSIDQITSVEWSPAMIDVGRRLASQSRFKAVRDGDWHRNSAVAELPASADLVVAGYLIGELAPAVLPQTIANWWSATVDELVIIEPGTPAGFARILHARTRLLAAGATVTAPCPSDETCPMAGSDWCHFSKRLARSP